MKINFRLLCLLSVFFLMFGNGIALSQVNLQHGLVAHFPFNGDAAEVSGNGHHGVVFGAVLTEDRFGNSSSAYLFQNAYITIPPNTINNLPQGSVSVFILTNQQNSQQSIIDKTQTNSFNYFQIIIDNNNKIRVLIDKAYNQSTNTFYSTSTISANTWTHIVVTWDGQRIKIFLNGEVDSSHIFTGSVIEANRQPYIGKVDNNTAFFNGKIDDIRIYNRPLNEQEILLLYYENNQYGPISNISVNQRTDGSGMVDVYFTLNGSAASYNVLIEASFDGGNTFAPVSSQYLSGDVSGISPGNRHIVWDGLGSFPNTFSTQTKLKITATPGGEWPTDTQTQVVEVLNPATGKIWMDRNLGASRAAISSTDAEAYGHLYQWGRAADGHQLRNSPTTSTLSNSDNPGHGNFILAPNSPYDWRNPQNNNLWQGINGLNNPCPAGYRLPTIAELDAERLSWSTNNAAGAFNSPLKLPFGGYRYRGNGSLDGVGSYGRYWSSTVDGFISRVLYFYSSTADTSDGNRANGGSVRCLKD
jgi:uncharacterized protein (TIGR02145 family)